MANTDRTYNIKNGLFIDDRVFIGQCQNDPTVGVGETAPIGSFILRKDDIRGITEMYKKIGAGNTEWTPVGSDYRSLLVAEPDNKEIYISISGDDTTADGSINAPYKTIERLIGSLKPLVNNITIRFFPGSYIMTKGLQEVMKSKVFAGKIVFCPVSGQAWGVTLSGTMTANTWFTHTDSAQNFSQNVHRGKFIRDNTSGELFPISSHTNNMYRCGGSITYGMVNIGSYSLVEHNVRLTMPLSEPNNMPHIIFEDMCITTSRFAFTFNNGAMHFTRCYIILNTADEQLIYTNTAKLFFYKCALYAYSTNSQKIIFNGSLEFSAFAVPTSIICDVIGETLLESHDETQLNMPAICPHHHIKTPYIYDIMIRNFSEGIGPNEDWNNFGTLFKIASFINWDNVNWGFHIGDGWQISEDSKRPILDLNISQLTSGLVTDDGSTPRNQVIDIDRNINLSALRIGGLMKPRQQFEKLINAESDDMGLLIPFYVSASNIYSNAEYNTLINIKKKYHDVKTYVILNPNIGPGEAVDSNYTAAVQRLKGAGIYVLGYVKTEYAARNINLVKTDIMRWFEFYPELDGIFFDEMTYNVGTNNVNLNYYREINDYAHTFGAIPTIGNVGGATEEAYFTNNIMDYIVTHEDVIFPTEAVACGDWDGGNADHHYKRRAMLVTNQTVINYDQLKTLMKYYGLIFVTHSNNINPWSGPSIHYESLLRLLSKKIQTLDERIINQRYIVGETFRFGNETYRTTKDHTSYNTFSNDFPEYLEIVNRYKKVITKQVSGENLTIGNNGTNRYIKLAALIYANPKFVKVYANNELIPYETAWVFGAVKSGNVSDLIDNIRIISPQTEVYYRVEYTEYHCDYTPGIRLYNTLNHPVGGYNVKNRRITPRLHNYNGITFFNGVITKVVPIIVTGEYGFSYECTYTDITTGTQQIVIKTFSNAVRLIEYDYNTSLYPWRLEVYHTGGKHGSGNTAWSRGVNSDMVPLMTSETNAFIIPMNHADVNSVKHTMKNADYYFRLRNIELNMVTNFASRSLSVRRYGIWNPLNNQLLGVYGMPRLY